MILKKNKKRSLFVEFGPFLTTKRAKIYKINKLESRICFIQNRNLIQIVYLINIIGF